MVKLTLTNDEAYTSISGLYKIIADKLGIQANSYDCKKVRVGNDIMEQCKNYCLYKGSTQMEFNMAWLCYGPKAMLDDGCVECDDGWYV